MDTTDPTRSFEETGQAWFRSALTEDALKVVDAWADAANRPGQRLTAPMPRLAVEKINGFVTRLLRNASLVRAVTFNKAGDTNWSVPWHQDRVIAVADRHDVDGFGNWTRKDGVWHCEPPLAFLQRMVFARLHLDTADLANGCMEIVPGSRYLGAIPVGDVADVAFRMGSEPCLAERGDLQILKMLTVHRSRTASDPSPRRAVRLDYAATALPKPLDWWSPDKR